MQTQSLILGSGPAGCTAAFYMAMAGFQTTMLMGDTPGGQLILTDKIENFPGYTDISGFDLTAVFQKQATKAGVQLLYAQAERLLSTQPPFRVQTNDGQEITTDTLIIATGASPRWLHIPGESRLIGHGVSVCATCDGLFFKKKPVAVIGNGNSAAYEALFLSKTSSTVYLIYNTPKLRAENNLIQQILKTPTISQIPNTQVLAFTGNRLLTGLQLKDLITNSESTLAVSGAFEAVGCIPNTQIFEGLLDIDPNGYLITNPETKETSVPGIFACGDIQEPLYRQAVIAAGSGCLAALAAKHYLLNRIKN